MDIGEMINAYKIFVVGSLKERDHSEGLGVDGAKIFKFYGNEIGYGGLNSSGLEQGPMAGSCKHVMNLLLP